ncbi:uncharacterized protein HMPREF1541_00261 [Cyphellophora europaea CBS 101466]|uniref:Zn(2)-C6 fungal-type domain-containing protein n=1 Tax=Cyphellophora europaea (strain CBS 101466) TaxID=1220924 RepID=W2SBJ4_CYPE1|nr:uncharacterized protein HMPREF1541_00261 [Cyphellophora europaea CBS 101466]ETN46077.1 hypothetical protein HMPREF1541_00261 [Cyphellophora europaea CBS 101466]
MADQLAPHIKSSPPQEGIARHPSLAESNDGKSPTHSRKRSVDQMTGGDSQITRKGRACLACRKLKVKCDSLERGDSGCSRCQRLGLECVTSKRLRVSLDDDGQTHPAFQRLERATEDILAKLKMPNLEAYSEPQQPVQRMPESLAPTTREPSREPEPKAEHDIAGAPMEGLFEATQLNTLRARLRGDPNKRSSRRKVESDLISQGIISIEEAEEMLQLYKTSLSRYLFNATISEARTLDSVRESSTFFFTAIMSVTSLHVPGKEKIHIQCTKALRDLIASSMFDRFHTLEDIRALCIAAFWLPDLSWKLSGHCVRMATELNLHQAFFKAFYSHKQTPQEREQSFEKARLWYLLYVLDHHFSIAYGRPPVTAELQAIKETDVFLSAPECTLSDRRVLSQVTLFAILSRAYNVFGLEAERLLEGDDVTLLTHARFIEEIERWRQKFRHFLQIDPHVGDYPAIGVDLHYNFASMMLNSFSLRGRSLTSIGDLPATLRPLALHAIEAAHKILQIVLERGDIKESLVGVPLYLHTMIAFAVVFLIKMSPRWKLIGVTIDVETRTRPLIEAIITTMRQSKAGANHIVYSMANGFERLLRRNVGPNGEHAGHLRQGHQLPPIMPPQDPNGRHFSAPILPGQEFQQSPGFGGPPRSNSGYDTYGISPSSGATYGGWQNEDDMLWSMNMGYDLLANAPDVNMASSYAFHDMMYAPPSQGG